MLQRGCASRSPSLRQLEHWALMAWNFTLYKDPQLPKPTLHHVPRMRRTQGPFPEVKWETQVGFCTEKWVPMLGYNVPDAPHESSRTPEVPYLPNSPL